MGLISKLFRTEPVEPALRAPEQAVLVCLKLSNNEIGTSQERVDVSALRDRLIGALQRRELGEFDALEFGDGFGTISLDGANADRLSEVVLPVVRTFPARPGSYLLRRYGEPGAREQSIVLGASA